jgi:hypothetical protein
MKGWLLAYGVFAVAITAITLRMFFCVRRR